MTNLKDAGEEDLELNKYEQEMLDETLFLLPKKDSSSDADELISGSESDETSSEESSTYESTGSLRTDEEDSDYTNRICIYCGSKCFEFASFLTKEF
ncbi:hypothetical protein AVEN_183063-1 [Araneus ventricosus]|uniref:Uncharacterized protein n=1 Tax=Araneus ventricosus TaxID=182803 RepID=A0A4Y2MPJ0_ARAVE|nr:hypothetical protein AVEN_183063-1 [Araneus ventricosus]